MKFDLVLLLPGDTYLRQWVNTHGRFYHENGWTADVYSETLNHTHLHSINQLITGFGGLRSVNSWWAKMKEYAEEKTDFASGQEFATEEMFPITLSNFLFSSAGAPYKSSFVFKTLLQCSQTAPKILVSMLSVKYIFMDNP